MPVQSNDVSIMTLTPIIIYFARATGCDPMVSPVPSTAILDDWQFAS